MQMDYDICCTDQHNGSRVGSDTIDNRYLLHEVVSHFSKNQDCDNYCTGLHNDLRGACGRIGNQ